MDKEAVDSLKQLFTMLARGDAGVISHPASNRENIGRICRQYSIPEKLLHGDPIDDLFLCLRHMLAGQFIAFFLTNTQKHMPVLRGLVVLYWKYFSPSVISKNTDILRACMSDQTVAEFGNFLLGTYGAEKIAPLDLADWFINAFGRQSSPDAVIRDADRRNLGKNENRALEQFALALYQTAPSIFAESRSESTVMRAEETSLDQARALVRELMLRHCASTPAALGINIPIQSCVRRHVRLGTVVLDTSVDIILTSLMGKSGTISCRPFLGASTLMRMLTVSVSEDEKSEAAACYIQAGAFYRYVLTHRKVYEYLADFLLDTGLIEPGLRAPILDQLQLLDQEGRLIFFVDDLNTLNDAQKEEMIQNLSFSPSVFYSVHLRDVNVITNQLKKTKRSLCDLELLEMDRPQQDSMLSLLLNFLGREGEFDLLYNRLLGLRQDPGGDHDILASPLGILALAVSTDSPRTVRTQIVLAALNEMLVRDGFGQFDLFMKYHDIDSAGLRTFAGWVSQYSNHPQAMSDPERARLAWRVQNDLYEKYERQGYIRVLNSALFQWELYEGKYGPERSYWFIYKDLAFFFIALNTYGSTKISHNNPFHDDQYINLIDQHLEARVRMFLADLKEYLDVKN